MKKGKLFLVTNVCAVLAITLGIFLLYKSGIKTSSPEVAAFAAYAKPVAQAKPAASKETSAERAIRTAAGRQRYVFVTFYKKGDAASDKMLATVKSLRGKLASRADFVSVDAGNSANQPLVKRYQADRATMPLTLVVAPNGAITAGYQKEIKSTDFSGVFVSGGEAAVLKTLQSGKLTLVCLQNGKTKFNKESMTAAEGLKADRTLPGLVGIVKIDPADRRESGFLQKCKVKAATTDAQVVMIIPPGKILGTFDGNTTKDKLMTSLQSAMASCGTGCGPSGCGP